MHQAVLGVEDALAGTYLAHLEKRLYRVVRTTELQLLHGDLVHIGFPVCQFLLYIQRYLAFVGQGKGLDGAIEGSAFSWLQGCLEVLLELCPSQEAVAAASAILLVGGASPT